MLRNYLYCYINQTSYNMNKFFSATDATGKEAILAFLMEDKIAMYFHFNETAHTYFKEKYPDLYGGDKKPYGQLRTAEGDLYLFAMVEKIHSSSYSITVKITLKHTGDATAYDDTRVLIKTTPSNPNGFTLDIPIEHINSITAVHRHPVY